MRADELVAKLSSYSGEKIRIMEVCGTHTMSIAKSGIKSILPENIKLVSGPGCPVCVMPPEIMDAVFKLTEKNNVIISSFGDMLKVPGSLRGQNLLRLKAEGANIQMVYSAMDALKLAENFLDKEVVFLGVGFETTAPGTAAAIKAAKERNIKNFSVFPMMRLVEPALRSLIESDDFNIDGFLCPGHVGMVIGENGFRFLVEDYEIPSVIAGFEPENIIYSIYLLSEMVHNKKSKLLNAYESVVKKEGNLLAQRAIEEVFYTSTSLWRGLGELKESGFSIRKEFREFDAIDKFCIKIGKNLKTACRCGDVIKGQIEPRECPFFSKHCTPLEPIGPCMVSSEGACAAEYKYSGILG